MKKWARRLMDYFTNPSLTFFDVAVVLGVIPIGYLSSNYRGIYFTFFSIFLIILSQSCKQFKTVKSPWITLLLLWSFISVFIHSWSLTQGSVIYRWVNFSLMSEGFIYILFGVLLFKTIAEYGRNLRLLYITIPLSLIPTMRFMAHHGQVSMVMAFAISSILYLIFTKRVRFAVILTLLLFVVGFLLRFGGDNLNLYQWFIMKFTCRPYVWVELCRQIAEHPFIGSGYNKLLLPDDMVWVREISKVTYGWLWRHNDYLSISAFIGLPVLLPIVMILKGIFIRLQRFAYIIPFTAFCICPLFQITMFQVEKALPIIVLTALFYVET
jgi:hypothetical protein